MADQQEPPIWVDELVARNEELLKAVAENQALGRLADAVAYQELFQQNVLKLATFCDLSNEVLDSGDATLGGVVNRQDATVQQRVSQITDEKELENLVEQIPCAQCKRLRIGGNICRGLPPDGKGHLAPNWDYREGPEVAAAAPLGNARDEAARLREFSRRMEATSAPPRVAIPEAPSVRRQETTSQSHRRRWSEAEKALCAQGMERFGEKAHKKIAELIKTRTAAQVRTYIAKQRKAVAKPRAPAPAARAPAPAARAPAPAARAPASPPRARPPPGAAPLGPATLTPGGSVVPGK
ncbi:unnamed protein product [Pelagomonas calceolata]|uniref:SS18 N-terminal domain-containing protein n=1 Tax=Pelagomonas calceolata TaxID=35677 RepID=A0A8J2SLT9_9STRA|nr:unnamed protein product [Pelagomonas calceolata]